MTAVGCPKEIEVQLHQHSNGDGGSALSLVSRNSGATATIHVIGSSGSTGDESSGEEPPTHNTHYAVPPKKNRMKESNNNNLSSVSSLVSLIRGTSNKDIMNSMEDARDDDEDSGPSPKDGRVSTSLTSGENSDVDMGPDGDDQLSLSGKSDDAGKKLFECDVCNMKFSNGANMRRHRMRHTGVKPYECRICQKRFFRKDHLAEHMATHSKLLPFRCPICNKGFQRQIAMRAHFQNEHVGGSHDMVKACPLCSYKAGSMKSLRVHFYSRHGIDLDNPMPNSSSLLCSNGTSAGSPNPHGASNGEYSELAQALGFEDREKSTDSSVIPSHFLVPQIEISSNSPYPPHFSFNADSSYNFNQDDRLGVNRSPTPPQHISPQSDSSSSNLPSSTDLLVVKKEVMEETSPEQSLNGETKSKDSSEMSDDIQDMPEDLSSNNSSSCRSHSPKCSSSSLLKVSPLKSLLRDEWRSKETSQGNGTNGTAASSRERSDSSSGHSSNSNFHTQTYDGEAITSSNGPENGAHSMYNRRGATYPSPLHQCVYCGIIFPDKTLYFLHKGCHSESNPWRCNICGESCSNVYDFNSHLLSKSHQ